MSAIIDKLKSELSLAAKMAYNRHLIRSKYPSTAQLRNNGIGIVAEANYICSLSQLARDFIDKMTMTAIPFAFINSSIPFRAHTSIKNDEASHYHTLECTRFDQRHVIHFSTIQCGMDKRYCNAITPFWEFQSGMLEHRPGLFKGTDVVIAYSDFLKDYYESLVPRGIKVIKFHYPYFPLPRKNYDKTAIRRRFNLPENAFTVFYNFDFGSCYGRKNPEAVLNAFAAAFPTGTDTALVFKTSHANSHKTERNTLQVAAEKQSIERRTFFIDDHLSRKDVIELTASADAYISLHRGEGLGMGMLEAMSLGIPVIATAYGGNTDFIREDTAFPVPYKLIPAHTNFDAYAHVTEWADPDIDAAATTLRNLYNNAEFANSKTSTAVNFITSNFSLASFETDIKEYLSL